MQHDQSYLISADSSENNHCILNIYSNDLSLSADKIRVSVPRNHHEERGLQDGLQMKMNMKMSEKRLISFNAVARIIQRRLYC